MKNIGNFERARAVERQREGALDPRRHRAEKARQKTPGGTGPTTTSTYSAEHSADPAKDWFSRYGIRHIAIIPDGNRRWARARAFSITKGHSAGLLKVLPNLVEGLSRAGVHTLTAWGFSTENWHRDRAEIGHLMAIFSRFLEYRLMQIAAKYDARVVHLGRKDRLPGKVVERLAAVESATYGNTSHVYNIALDYGGGDELTRAARKMAAAASRDGRPRGDLRIGDFLDTSNQPFPEPDIVIRSSGEFRLSGFLPLQAAYSELFFVKESFPDFTMNLMERVAEQYCLRRRRFGG